MQILKYIFSLIIVIISSAYSYAQRDTTTQKKPNIVLILVDDSGLMDLGAFGGEARTPNIDKLANQGLMMTNMHASPVCAPSRAMLLTGTDSHLAGVANLPEMLPEEYQSKPGYAGVLNDRVQTIATRLKEAGYNTYATGKWHLGHDDKTLPNKKGFDRSFMLGGSGAHNYSNRGYLPMKPIAHWYEDGKEVELPKDFYSSKTYIDKTILFHEEEKNKENPFFSYIAFQAVHAPIQAPKEFVEPYREVYAKGWDKLRQDRFEKAKKLGIIPANAQINAMFPTFRKWDDLSEKDKKAYSTNMAMMAGMLEAMDFHIGRYVKYLTEAGLMENTIFIITSDNGPDGADYSQGMIWAETKGGYHRDFDKRGSEDYFGYLGHETANAMASPFSFFKYYTGEGGLRVPLIINGKGLPQGHKSNAFCFFTDIAPTIYDFVGISTSNKEGYAPITGKSILPHIRNFSQPIYGRSEGVGLETASSSAYFLDGYKIVKNNIPLGDNQWYLYNLENDPGETQDIKAENPELFQKMLAAYEAYAKSVGVLEMPEGYSASGEVAKKSYMKILMNLVPYLLMVVIGIFALVLWLKRRKRKAN
jgi:arylsulfatase/uncharacterized sulfatase